MKKIMESDHDNTLREVNTDAFIQRCNQELIVSDPVFAQQMGIKVGDIEAGPDLSQQTPEELAAQEAERDRILQENMQSEVINAVMRRVEGNMGKYDERMAESLDTIKKELNSKFSSQEQNMSSNIKNLEKYLEDVHATQISEVELLKKFTYALAANKTDEIEATTSQHTVKQS